MVGREDRAEQKANADDEAAQERAGAAPHNIGVQSPGYSLVPPGMHPDRDEAVTFVRGELLPGWAADALLDQRPEPDEHGVCHLAAPSREWRES
ncbi:MAG: hypothetical protein ABJA86_13320 [Nocardioidaceae bacterium]